MKAIVQLRYGGPEVLQVEDLPKPVPGENDVLVHIRAASVTAADGMMREGKPRYGRLFTGFSRPKHQTPGTGFAGVVEAVGPSVKRYRVGDRIFGETVFGPGAHAEYVCVPETGLTGLMPPDMTFDEGATVCDGPLTSYSFLKDIAQIKSGNRVLINGASGSLGTAAVQLARNLGADITAVCGPGNIEFVKSLGAHRTIDYTKTDLRQIEGQYDFIFDTVGKSSFRQCKPILSENGVYMSPVLGFRLLIQMMRTSMFGRKRAIFSATGMRSVAELQPLLDELSGLYRAGKLTVHIDRRYSLSQVIEANAYVATGHKRGNVVLTTEGQNAAS